VLAGEEGPTFLSILIVKALKQALIAGGTTGYDLNFVLDVARAETGTGVEPIRSTESEPSRHDYAKA
jgi:hypothetical protein